MFYWLLRISGKTEKKAEKYNINFQSETTKTCNQISLQDTIRDIKQKKELSVKYFQVVVGITAARQ